MGHRFSSQTLLKSVRILPATFMPLGFPALVGFALPGWVNIPPPVYEGG